MSRTRVAVLRGGPSSEYDVSLKTGSAVLQNLSEEKYAPQDVLIDKAGVWHMRGCPRSPATILQNIDVVFNALHGEFGEDGKIQKILHRYGVPYTGSGISSSAVCMNKFTTKDVLEPFREALDLKFAKHKVVYPSESFDGDVLNVFATFTKPIVVKPVVGGSSVGVSITDERATLLERAHNVLEHSPGVFFEEYVKGKEATCGVLEGFRGQSLYALLPIEIRPAAGHEFFDYEAKYGGASEEICPGNFRNDESEKLQNLAKGVHEALGLRHYSRSDFIVTPEGIYFLEVNTLPGLTEESLVPKALQAVGCSFPLFLDYLVELALRREG